MYKHMHDPEKKRKVAFIFTLIVAKLALLGVLFFVVAEAYVRWKLNQNFTFLGGFGTESLVLLLLGSIWGLLYASRD